MKWSDALLEIGFAVRVSPAAEAKNYNISMIQTKESGFTCIWTIHPEDAEGEMTELERFRVEQIARELARMGGFEGANWRTNAQ